MSLSVNCFSLEKLILQEYNELQNFDQNNINAALGRLDAEYVICPVCKRYSKIQLCFFVNAN